MCLFPLWLLCFITLWWAQIQLFLSFPIICLILFSVLKVQRGEQGEEKIGKHSKKELELVKYLQLFCFFFFFFSPSIGEDVLFLAPR